MTSNDIKPLRILAVDDDKFMLNVIVRALKGVGIENVFTATDGERALAVLDSQGDGVDVLLCDLNMPGMDGVEFLRHVAERKFQGGVVVISGEDDRILKSAERLAQAHNLRILGALPKPVTRQGLAQVLGRLGTTAQRGPSYGAELITEEELRRGIHGDEIIVFFQPKVEIATRRVLGVESLVRWNHPTQGIVGPNAFIPVAEKWGLIDPLTDAVFMKAMKQAAFWRTEGLDLKVAVNISVESLNRFDFPELIVSRAAEQGIDPSHVMLEVTESRLMQDITKSLEILTRLRLKRIGLSIDDFGTGYSSMAQLQRIPFEELKIDRAFVHGATQDSAARAILESSVDLANKLHMTVVAEGVETQEDWDLVAQQGVQLVQGYFVAKPMPGEDLCEWIAEWYLDEKDSS